MLLMVGPVLNLKCRWSVSLSEKLSIVVAEDNARDREFIQSVLKQHDLHIATNGEQALEFVKKYNIVNIVSDIQMPKLNGIDLGRQIWAANPDARIVFWSQFRDEIYLRSLKEIIPAQTVYGYVLKSNPSEVLNQAAQLVFRDYQCWIDPGVRTVKGLGNKAPEILSDAEYEVLVDIALGLTDNMIAERRFLTRRGVQSRLALVYQKLGVDRASTKNSLGDTYNSRSRAISMALNRGLINTFELGRAEKAMQEWLTTQRKR